MKALLCLLLTACACFGQYMPMADPAWFGTVATPASAAAPFSPTNIAGVPAKVWLVAENFITNDGTHVSIPDFSGNGYSATNTGSAGTWPTWKTNYANGRTALTFDGSDDRLKLGLTIAQPFEVIFVAAHTNFGSANHYLFGALTKGTLHITYNTTNAVLGAGTAYTAGYIPNGQVFIYDFVFNGASSAGYTNNIAAFSNQNLGTGSPDGTFYLFDRADAGNPAMGGFLEMIIYGGATALPSASDRTNIYTYLKDKYGQ